MTEPKQNPAQNELETHNQNDDSTWFEEGDGKTTNISKLFEIDRPRELAAADPSLQEIDRDATIEREAVANEEKQIPLFKNPLVKTAVVVGGIGTLIGLCAWVFLKSTSMPTKVAEKPEPPKEEFKNPTVGESQLKGQLALDKQNEMLKAGKTPAIAPTPTPTPTPSAVPKPTVKPLAQPTPTATPATNAYKPNPPSPTPVTRPYVPSPPVVQNYPIAKAVPIATPERPPIYQKKPQIAAKPAYMLPVVPKTTVATKPVTPPPTTQIAPTLQAPQSWQQQATSSTFGGRFNRESSTQTVASIPAAAPQTYLASENEIYGEPGKPRQIIPAGAKSLGLLLTPIQIAAGDTTEQIATIGLNQPLVDRYGRVVVPAGSQVQFKLTVLANGWLKATGATVNLSGQITNIAGNFSLVTDRGEPLIAQSLTFGEDKVAREDQKSFILGALQNVGAILTQPNTQSSVNSTIGGISSSTSSQSNPNVIGGILQGGFNPLAQQQLSRSTAEIQRLLNAPKLWFVPSGTNIQIVNNQPLTI